MRIAYIKQNFSKDRSVCIVDNDLIQWVENGAKDAFVCKYWGNQQTIVAGSVQSVEVYNDFSTTLTLAFHCLIFAVLIGSFALLVKALASEF